MPYAGLFVFLLGLILVIVAPINKRKNTRCSAEANGTLSDIRRKINSKGHRTTYYTYTYFVDGIEYKIKSTILSSQAHKTGESCTIWYNPKKPKVAQPFHYESTKIYNIIIIFGAVMIPLGIVLLAISAAH